MSRFRRGDLIKCACFAKGFVENDSHGRGEIQAANLWIWHRDRQASIPIQAKHFSWQSARFSPKNEAIVWVELPGIVISFSLSGEINKARLRQSFIEFRKVRMFLKLNLRPIIQTGSFDCLIVETETSDANDM